MPDRGANAPWIGANFWSRNGGPRMWSRYDADIVREELAVLRSHGCNMTRSFCYWPDFVPTRGQLNEEVVERFADFLAAHRALGMKTIPTFLVGHMSGENWDPSWRSGRDLYRDVTLVADEAWFACELARRFADDAAIAGWLVSNEMPLYGGSARIEEITSWARLVVQAIRAGGATQPVSLGDGAWGIEVSGRDNGYSVRALAPLVDFVGPHVYPMEDDQVRQFLTAAFACRLSGTFSLPVVLEEFGLTSDFAADEYAADYYRHVLYSSLVAGASGWIAWNNCDFDDLSEEDPYRHHLFELHFGLTDRAGRPKPQLEEMARFSGFLSTLGNTFGPVESDAGLVVPEHFERELPFTTDELRADIRQNLFQAYIAGCEADLALEPLRERDGLIGGKRLYLLPGAKLITGPGLTRIRELAEDGAVIYASYFAGSTANQRGPWITWLPEIFGVRHLLRYGLVDPIEDNEVTFEIVEPLGELVPGDFLRFRVAGNASARCYLPVDPVDAKVLAVDGHGRPALVQHGLGAGTSILCTYPIEYFAALHPSINPEDTWRLYSALASAAGVDRPVRIADGRVLVGRVASASREIVVVENCSADALDVPLLLAAGVELERHDGVAWQEGARLHLEPFGIEVLCRRDPAGARP